MMPTIRISDSTWARLKKHAVPLEDTAEDVVKRLLDEYERARGKQSAPTPVDSGLVDTLLNRLDEMEAEEQKVGSRETPNALMPGSDRERSNLGANLEFVTVPVHKERGTKLPQKEFRTPLLETLRELGGKASVLRVREVMERKMAPRLSEADYKAVSSGDPRWWNAICWERMRLVNEGLLRKDSARGIWELTDKGNVAAKST